MKKVLLITILSTLFFTGKGEQNCLISHTSPIHIHATCNPIDHGTQTKTSPYKRQHKFKALARALAGFFTLAVLSSHVNSDNNHPAPATLLIDKSTK